MGLGDTLKADLGKVGHAFVVGAKALKSALIWAAGQEQKIAPEVAAVESVANKVVAAIYPGAEVVAIAIETVMNHVFAAVDAAGAAALQNGMDITLDIATLDALKAALPIVKAQSLTTPGS